VAKDEAHGAQLIGKACDAGGREACYNLALLYADGRGVTADPKRAAALYKKSCDAGDQVGCAGVARLGAQ
jgi:TPR repeat protein